MEKENWKYLFVDRHNEGLLCETPTRSIGLNLLGGILDGRVIELPLHRVIYSDFAKYDYEWDLLRVSPKRMVSPLDPKKITERFLSRRKEAKIRAKYLGLLEMISFLSRGKESLAYPHYIEHLLGQEVDKSRPEDQIYTLGIREYANINQITPSAAYEEIKFKIQGANMIAIRDYAIFQKYVRIFNTCPIEKLEDKYFELRQEIFLYAST